MLCLILEISVDQATEQPEIQILIVVNLIFCSVLFPHSGNKNFADIDKKIQKLPGLEPIILDFNTRH